MARLLLILVFAAVVFWVFSVVDTAVQPAVRHRGVTKPVWVAIVVLLPVIGGVLWFTIGRLSASAMRVSAPDDDPEFLRSLGRPTPPRPATSTPRATPPPTTPATPDADVSRAEQDERIRRLEEELARRDRDDDDRHGPHRAR